MKERPAPLLEKNPYFIWKWDVIIIKWHLSKAAVEFLKSGGFTYYFFQPWVMGPAAVMVGRVLQEMEGGLGHPLLLCDLGQVALLP